MGKKGLKRGKITRSKGTRTHRDNSVQADSSKKWPMTVWTKMHKMDNYAKSDTISGIK